MHSDLPGSRRRILRADSVERMQLSEAVEGWGWRNDGAHGRSQEVEDEVML